MSALLERLHTFNKWANNQVINSIIDSEIEDEKVLSLMSHILNAESIWIERIYGESAARYSLWQKHGADDMPNIHEDLLADLRDIFENEDLSAKIEYVNSKGVEYDSTIEEILLHIVDHATYHRGQLATRYRELGIKPLETNVINWTRAAT